MKLYLVFENNDFYTAWQTVVWQDYLDTYFDRSVVRNGKIEGRNAKTRQRAPNKKQTTQLTTSWPNPSQDDNRVMVWDSDLIKNAFKNESYQELYHFQIVDEQFVIDGGWISDNP